MSIQVQNTTNQSLRVTYRAAMAGNSQSDLVANQPVIEFPASKTISLNNALWRAANGPLIKHYLAKKVLVVVGEKGKKLSSDDKSKSTAKERKNQEE